MRGTGRMRIAQVAPLFASTPPQTYGGTERVVSYLTEELARRGHEVTLFATSDSRTRAKLRAVRECGLFETWAREGYCAPEYCHLASAAEALSDPDAFDIAHFHMGAFSVPLSAVTPTPTVHSCGTKLDSEELWTIERFPNAVVTARSRSQIRNVAAARRASIHVLPNGCDFEFLDFTPGPRPYLAFLGRMCEDKNPLDAILAARMAGIPIVLAGEPWNESDTEYFEQRIRPLVRAPEVRWIGAVNEGEKRELLRQAAALLFPIRWDEAFGIVMIEAMACGAPVVAYDEASVPEVVEDGVTGFVCRTVEEMAKGIDRAVALDAAAVRAAALPRFGLKAFGDRYENLYNLTYTREASAAHR